MTEIAGRPAKAADLDDVDVLRTVQALCSERGMWAATNIVADRYAPVPPKVVAAKLSRLLKRGLLSGCDCGCRGDWELTAEGRNLVTGSGRPNLARTV